MTLPPDAYYRHASDRLPSMLTVAGMIGAFLFGAFSVLVPVGFLSYLLLTGAVLFFLFAGTAAFALRGPIRAYWGGLAFVGLAYLRIALHPWFVNISSNLATTRLLAEIWASANADPERAAHFAVENAVEGPTRRDEDERDLRNIMVSGQAAWSIFLAFPAGLLCFSIALRRLRRESAP